MCRHHLLGSLTSCQLLLFLNAGSLRGGYKAPFRSYYKYYGPARPGTSYSQADGSWICTSSPDLPNRLFHANLHISSVPSSLKCDSSPPRTPTSLSGGLPQETAWPLTPRSGQNPEPPPCPFHELPNLSCQVCSVHLGAAKAATVPRAVSSARSTPPVLTCLAAMTSDLVSSTHSSLSVLDTTQNYFFTANQ